MIFGGTGFLGTNLATSIASLNHNVIIVDNFFKKVGLVENLAVLRQNGLETIHCDVRNKDDVDRVFEMHSDVDVVLNVAAQVAFSVSVERPRLDFEINALGNFNLLECVRQKVPECIYIYASTNQVYGDLPGVRTKEFSRRFDFVDLEKGVPETYPLDFLSPYGCSKGAADQYTRDYARVYDLQTVVLRLGGIYGGHQYSTVEHGWVSFIAGEVALGRSFDRFGHGKQVRDILYVTDIVDAFLAAVERIDVAAGQIYNIGGGAENTMSVLELIDYVADLASKPDLSRQQPMRKADKLVMYLDTSKAYQELGWKPRVSKFEGIKQLLEWKLGKQL